MKQDNHILRWNHVVKDRWSYRVEPCDNRYLIYSLSRLPDFTNPRFDYLCQEADGRAAEVVKRQMIMLRQLHGLGPEWSFSLRLKKENSAITLYLVFRFSGSASAPELAVQEAEQRIENALMRTEYSFRRESDAQEAALDVSWMQEAAEITKNEQEYQSDRYPDGTFQSFYVPYTWTAADNNMERICRALMNHSGTAAVDITMIPTQYLEEERQWVNSSVRRLKDCMNGETFRSADGRIIWQAQKLPMLKTPLDNFEKMNKQYEASRLFLVSLRVYSDSGADLLANALLVNSAKNEGVIQVFRRGYGAFDYLISCYRSGDVSADAHSAYWNRHQSDAPYRAQRLPRLVSVEEASNFFRIPVPIKPGFPGFGFDTGIDSFVSQKKARSIIRLGSYLDESGADHSAAQFDSQQFAKHGLIVGVPGSGKTTAMFNILYQLWDVPEEQKIPFIILEPAKTEYRALKTLDIFKDDMLVFTLGDEGVSPFRFNPMEVLPGIRLESHISKLQACFVGAFDLFDPLPIFLEQAIRRTYLEKGWYDDSRGGEPGLETPTISDLCRNAEYIVSHSGFDSKMRSDFQASLLERLNSLRRGSKGRMLDTRHSIPMEDLMQRPVVLELDSLNGDEKSLIMMFLLSYVYEYCKVNRKSGSPLRHMLLVEEAHNLIAAQDGGGSHRADPKAQTIELFVNMLAEMRALGQGILIADQLPTAITPQAVKQTNVKILMRVTAKDDREEIGNTMDLNEEQMHQVVNFKTGNAYLYHEGEDRVRAIRMLNFKGEHDVEEPPSDEELRAIMAPYEAAHEELFMPYPECSGVCSSCNRRVRNQAESLIHRISGPGADAYDLAFQKDVKSQRDAFRKVLGLCGVTRLLAKHEAERIAQRYGEIGACFGACVYIHLLHQMPRQMEQCGLRGRKCACGQAERSTYLEKHRSIREEE